MDKKDLNRYYNKFKFGEDIYHRLQPCKIRDILLVSSFYDAFIFEQDGRFSEQLFGEYHQLNLTSVPRITSVPTGKEALDKIEERHFDMVITTYHIGDVTPFEMADEIKRRYPVMPVVLLLNVQADAARIDQNSPKLDSIDEVFLWSGDSKVFLAIIKYFEDSRNVEHDTKIGDVRIILLVEDSIFYYSRFLPELYQEVMLQVQLLLSDELEDAQKNYRMRTRPKILMAHTYEDAIELSEKYHDYLLCLVSDIRFPRKGKVDYDAGFKLANHFKEFNYDIPILLQSADKKSLQKAEKQGFTFIDKNSPLLLNELSDYIHWNLGFGDFVFRDESTAEYGRARNLAEFENLLQRIPDKSLLYHARRNDFSTWLIAHGEINVARNVRPVKIKDFDDVSEIRNFLIGIFAKVRDQHNRGKIVEFREHNLDLSHEIIRLAQGSVGGKGRGIAFLNALLAVMDFEKRYPELKVKIPRTAFIGTGEYDEFLKKNFLRKKITNENRTDEETKSDFINGRVSDALQERLSAYLEHVNKPIAVRSSGLLEDSRAQPFAGIYQTYMLPNNHPDKEVRLRQLLDAIKLVFASTCLSEAMNYVNQMNYSIEEEKMAVIIQEIVGEQHGDYFYPHVSGVAQSYNFYPTSYAKHDDGVASLALGLGEWVVSGKRVFRFCPGHPQMEIIPHQQLIANSQRKFYAINMNKKEFDLTIGEEVTYETLDLTDAQEHGVLDHIVSVWDFTDMRLRDGNRYSGQRVLTFADIVRYDYIPLTKLLVEILDIGKLAFGVPVEIEFAITLGENGNDVSEFNILQIRPLAVAGGESLEADTDMDKDSLWLYSGKAMGNGVFDDVCDIIYVDPAKFDKLKTLEILEEVKIFNQQMRDENKHYILIGPGRWGSRDRFLGIPVRWSNIDMTRVIVEAEIEGYQVDASQGTHFFHNLVASNTGYLNIPLNSNDNFIDWDWLNSQPVEKRSKYLVHVRRENPFIIKMFGDEGIAAIWK